MLRVVPWTAANWTNKSILKEFDMNQQDATFDGIIYSNWTFFCVVFFWSCSSGKWTSRSALHGRETRWKVVVVDSPLSVNGIYRDQIQMFMKRIIA